MQVTKCNGLKTSRILMLRIKPVTKLKSSREKPAIRYVPATRDLKIQEIQ